MRDTSESNIEISGETPDAGRYLLVYVTAPDAACAKTLSRTVVEERLAACSNLLEGMHSIYHWQDKIVESTEVVCLFKTTRERSADLMARIRALHPYEVPCIVALPIQAGFTPFLEWIDTETQDKE